MRFVLFNWLDPRDVELWDRMTVDEQQGEVQRHVEWFRRYRESIVGGEELDEPRTVKTLRPGPQQRGVIVTDGPYVEAKEILGGFVILDAADIDDALRIASDWPSLSTMPNVTVQLQPAVVRG